MFLQELELRLYNSAVYPSFSFSSSYKSSNQISLSTSFIVISFGVKTKTIMFNDINLIRNCKMGLRQRHKLSQGRIHHYIILISSKTEYAIARTHYFSPIFTIAFIRRLQNLRGNKSFGYSLVFQEKTEI